MGGLANICKLYGSMVVKNNQGESITYIWDYVSNQARKASEMSEDEIRASEKAKWELKSKALTK